MSAIDERVASIRMFTVPGRPVEVLAVYQYSAVAADWERLGCAYATIRSRF
jgi:hypothetical protein